MRAWVLVAIAGCGRVSFDPVPGLDAATRCTRWSTWSAPVRLAGPINSVGNDDWSPAPALGETALVFHSFRPPSQDADLWIGTRPDRTQSFGAPQIISGLSTSFTEDEPSLTEDGLDIVFSSNRAGTFDIYLATRATLQDPWSAAAPVTNVNSASYDTTPWISGDGLTLMLASTDPASNTQKLFVATRPDRTSAFGPRVEVTELGSTGSELGPTLSTDGLEIFFASTRPGGPGNLDVYTARRSATTQPFQTPVLVPELSTADDDTGLHLARDGATIYLNYDTLINGGADADMWTATRTCRDD